MKTKNSRLFQLVCGALLLTGLAQPAQATDFYVSSNGNDLNPGTSSTSAWRTIAKVNQTTFRSGDRLLFEGGQTFAGAVTFTASDGGSLTIPFTVGSYGTGRATINGGAGTALTITDATGIRVNNLNFVGLGRKTGNNGGRGILLTGTTGVRVDQVETSGFQRAGVEFLSSTDVRLTNVYAHANGFAGITGRGSSNAYIGYCRAIDNPGDPTRTTNHSGNGIVVSVQTGTIEYCEAANNGYDMQQTNANGPVGIWCYESNQLTIQHCVSHNNSSPAGKVDGGGFDFDGGVTNSVMQYNYAYENKSYGFLAWEYGSPIRWSGNVIRYNISANNTGPGLLLGNSSGAVPNNCDVYNNIFYSPSYPAVELDLGAVTNFKVRNNIFLGPSSRSLVYTGSGMTYQGNDYWFTNGGFNVGGYSSLSAWINATGQEKVGTSVVGLNANPQFRDPANYERLTDPTRLSTLTAFLVPATSPVVDAGLNMQSLFGINPGSRDYYGNALAGPVFDMGAQEQSRSTPTSTAVALLNPGFEADGAAVLSPQGWTTWPGTAGVDADADYTETNGGGRSGLYHGTHYKASAYEVLTWQAATGLANGLYTLRAWIKSGGGQTTAALIAKNYGGAPLTRAASTTSGGANGAWQQVTITDINVTNGKCEIGFYSVAGAGQWLFFDDVELVRQSAAARGTTALASTSPTSPEPLACWPNPANDHLTVSYPAIAAGTLDVQLVSLLGQLVLKQQQAVGFGTNQFVLNTKSVAPGLYVLRIADGAQVYTRRMSIGQP